MPDQAELVRAEPAPRPAPDRPVPAPSVPAVGEPVWVAWREGTLTRAAELEALSAWIRRMAAIDPAVDSVAIDVLGDAVTVHLEAARSAARRTRWVERFRTGARLERAMSNLDAAEAHVLHMAPPSYLLGQMPSLVNHARRHLTRTDPRRRQLERIAAAVDLAPRPGGAAPLDEAERLARVARDRGQIVSATRGASSAALREQLRVRSFRNVLILTTVIMAAITAALAVVGWLNPQAIPLCFAPEEAGVTTVVCPTGQEGPVPTPAAPVDVGGAGGAGTGADVDIDVLIARTTNPGDVALVALVGLTAAAIAAAGALGHIRGSSEPYGVPLALALLKLPSGAVTAVLGLLLLRGEFVPGLSALDTSAQILAWALVFGYAQQLFTRLADHQAHTVLDGVRGASKDQAPNGS